MFGDGPVAHALAGHLAGEGNVVRATVAPQPGPWLWRQVDPASGRGVKQVVEGAGRVFVVLDEPMVADGLFLVLRRLERLQGAVVLPLGTEAPPVSRECRGLARVHHGPAWGPEEPLAAAWVRAITAGRAVWVADPGPIRPVPLAEVVQGAVEAASRGAVHWSLAGERAVRLCDLAEGLARDLGRPLRVRRVPLRWAAWRAGVDPRRLEAWTRVPITPRVADGWRPGVSNG